MDYLEIKIALEEKSPKEGSTTEANSIQEIESRLSSLGIFSYVINDPKEVEIMLSNLDDTEWYDREQVDIEPDEIPSITVYVENNEDGRLRASMIEDLFFGNEDVTVSILNRSDEEWKDKWKEYFRPTQITSRVIVMPSWSSPEDVEAPASQGVSDSPGDSASPGDSDEMIVVRIDPGMAFGTGTHETTSLTIELMEKYIREGDRLLDVGTGSGILAIIADKLGAGRILGIDIDPEAVRTARENYSLNDNNYTAEFEVGDLTEGVDFQADIIVANLLTNLVIRFTPDAKKHLASGGIYISSGILAEHLDRVIKNMEACGFHVLEILTKGEWCAIAAGLAQA